MKDETTRTMMTQTFSEVAASSDLKKGLRGNHKIFDVCSCVMNPDERNVLIIEFDISCMISIG